MVFHFSEGITSMSIRDYSITNKQHKFIVQSVNDNVGNSFAPSEKWKGYMVSIRMKPLDGINCMSAFLFLDREDARPCLIERIDAHIMKTAEEAINDGTFLVPMTRAHESYPDSPVPYVFSEHGGVAAIVRRTHFGRGVYWVSNGVVPADLKEDGLTGLTELPLDISSDSKLVIGDPVWCIRFDWMCMCWVQLCSSHKEASKLIESTQIVLESTVTKNLPPLRYSTDCLVEKYIGIESLNGIKIW